MTNQRIEIRIRTPTDVERVPLLADAELPAGVLLDFHVVENGEIVRSSEELADLLESPAPRQTVWKGFVRRFIE